MHPVARVFQILFLVAGFLLLAIGYSLFYEDYQQGTTVNVTSDCRAGVDGESQVCDYGGSFDPGPRHEAMVNMTAGGVLILAGGVVAVGGRRKEAARSASSVAPQPLGAAPMQPPPGAPYPGPAPQQQGY